MSKKVKNEPVLEDTAIEIPDEPEAVDKPLTPEQEEIALLQADLGDTRDRLLRTAAEYDNYRKRTQREKESLWNDASSAVVQNVLPVLDNLERAASADFTDAEPYAKGIGMVLTQLIETLTKLGVEVIEGTGETFDPNCQAAVSHIESEDFGENTVAQVFQKGYKLGDRLIRPAMVQVAN